MHRSSSSFRAATMVACPLGDLLPLGVPPFDSAPASFAEPAAGLLGDSNNRLLSECSTSAWTWSNTSATACEKHSPQHELKVGSIDACSMSHFCTGSATCRTVAAAVLTTLSELLFFSFARSLKHVPSTIAVPSYIAVCQQHH